MRDKTHDEHIERWANFVLRNPRWREYHTAFINAQFEQAYAFMKRLSKTKDGQKKIVEIYGIKNIKGYPKLLKDLQ